MEGHTLTPHRREFAETVSSLHRVAEQIVAPARKPDNEIALEATPGGFGTPVFEWEGANHQVRVEGVELVHSDGDAERRVPLESLDAAAEAVRELLPAGTSLDTRRLEVDEDSSRALAAWYAFGAELLNLLVAEAGSGDAPTSPTLWPEHFDIAIELGPEDVGGRANYGLSPGDDLHAEPYLYVGPQTAEVSGDLWNAHDFNGAELGYSELLGADDRERAAMDFFTTRRDALAAITGGSDE
jgi:hypothetical protein